MPSHAAVGRDGGLVLGQQLRTLLICILAWRVRRMSAVNQPSRFFWRDPEEIMQQEAGSATF